MKPYRLHLYNKHIVNFDFLDRRLNFNNITNWKNINLQININQQTNIQALTQCIILEILGQQRFLIKNKKSIFKTDNLKVSFCKNKLLVLLDIYLLSFIFNKNFCFAYKALIKKIHIFISPQIINNLNLVNSNQNFIQVTPIIKNSLNNFY